MSINIVNDIIVELANLLEPLARLDSPQRMTAFVRRLGWAIPADSDLTVDLNPVITVITDELLPGVIDVNNATTDEEVASAVIDLAGNIFDVVNEVRTVAPDIIDAIENIPRYITDPALDDATVLMKRLLDHLIQQYLRERHSRIFAMLWFMGIFDSQKTEQGIEFDIVHWERIPNWIGQPSVIFDTVYGWRSRFDIKELLKRLQVIIDAFGLPGGLYPVDPDIHAYLGNAQFDQELRVPLVMRSSPPDFHSEFGISISPSDTGIAIFPTLIGSIDIETEVSESVLLTIKGNAELNEGFALTMTPLDQISVETNLFTDTPVKAIDSRLEVSLRKVTHEGTLTLLFGAPDTSRFGFSEVGMNLLVAFKEGVGELGIELEVKDLSLVITTSGGDGFIQKILSGINIELVSDLVVGYSNLDGLYFRGSGGLELEMPIHAQLGPINVESLFITLDVADNINLTIAASFEAELGPIQASVSKIGLIIPMEFRGDMDGNLGPFEVSTPKFKPPIGAGLAISAGGIVGGGFVEFDDPNKRYAGILALNFGEIGLTAIGLITTRMPDGSEGCSLLVNIGVTFDPPIQLPYGFTLSGVGGLIGVNRTMDTEVLQRGIRNRTLDSILFPDPSTVIANASKIISDLRAAFPPSRSRFVVGPMVKFGWGANIITAEIGIFLELPDPIRIVLMGQLAAALPEEEYGIVVIHLDVLGVLDFAKEELTFQASLYDSRVLAFTMFGDSAFLLGWGNDPRFGLSLGGFHPKFTPPPPPIIFGDLKRLTICISSGSAFQLSCRAYQALTPNSLQFGARVDLYASGGGAEVTGYIGFDTLIYFSPFSFEVWIGAGVGIKYEGVSLVDVELNFLLAGPTPWLARGKAKIKILFVSVKVGFKITWGKKEKATLPAVDPWEPLQQALAAPCNWGGVLPDGRTLVESLRGREEGAPEQIVVHPAGRIEVRQNVVPLGAGLQKAGNAPVKDHDLFDITELNAGGENLTLDPVEEFFARGQYEELSSHDRLSVPSFEKMKGGVTNAASEAVRIDGSVESTPLEYESILIRPDRTSQHQEPKGTLGWEEGKFLAKASIKRRAIGRAGPRKRFGKLRAKPRVGVSEERYCIANADNLTRASLSSQLTQDNYDMTRMVADQTLAAQLELEPDQAGTLIVIPEYEVFEEAA